MNLRNGRSASFNIEQQEFGVAGQNGHLIAFQIFLILGCGHSIETFGAHPLNRTCFFRLGHAVSPRRWLGTNCKVNSKLLHFYGGLKEVVKGLTLGLGLLPRVAPAVQPVATDQDSIGLGVLSHRLT